MKPGLILPRFFPNDAIDGRRIDEHVKRLAEVVNGGLTGHSLAPTTKLLQAQFAEGKSVYTLVATFPEVTSRTSNPNKLGFGSLPAASAYGIIKGVSWAVLTTDTVSGRNLTIAVGGTTILVIPMGTKSITMKPPFPLVSNATPKTTLYGEFYPEYDTSVTANQPITAAWTLNGSETQLIGRVTLTMASVHQ